MDKKKLTYESPKAKVVTFKAERGFAGSTDGIFSLAGTDPEVMEENSNANEQFETTSTWQNAF